MTVYQRILAKIDVMQYMTVVLIQASKSPRNLINSKLIVLSLKLNNNVYGYNRQVHIRTKFKVNKHHGRCVKLCSFDNSFFVWHNIADDTRVAKGWRHVRWPNTERDAKSGSRDRERITGFHTPTHKETRAGHKRQPFRSDGRWKDRVRNKKQKKKKKSSRSFMVHEIVRPLPLSPIARDPAS